MGGLVWQKAIPREPAGLQSACSRWQTIVFASLLPSQPFPSVIKVPLSQPMQVLLLLLFLFSALLLWGENFPSFPFTLCLCANILVLEACLCLTTSLPSIQTSVKGVTNLKEMQIKWISHCQNARCYKGKETSLSRKITKGKSHTISHSYPSTLRSD